MKRCVKLEKQVVEALHIYPAGTKVRFWLGPVEGEGAEGRILDFMSEGRTQALAYIRASDTKAIVLVPLTHFKRIA